MEHKSNIERKRTDKMYRFQGSFLLSMGSFRSYLQAPRSTGFFAAGDTKWKNS